MGAFEGANKKNDIFELMEKFEKSSITDLELEITDTIKIKLSKAFHSEESKPAAGYSVASVFRNTEEPVGSVIKAPIIGTFYSSPSPESEPYVRIGDKIKTGAVMCIIEAMKVMNEIECEQDCEVLEILINNGDQVEYGQPMFRIK